MTTLAMLVIVWTIPLATRRQVDIGEAGREARQAVGRGHTHGDEKRVGLRRERATQLRFDRIDRVLDLAGTRQGPEQVPDPGHEGRHDDDDDADEDRHDGQHAEQRGQQARHEPVEGVDDRPDHVGDQPADHERQQGWPRGDRKPHHGSDHRDASAPPGTGRRASRSRDGRRGATIRVAPAAAAGDRDGAVRAGAGAATVTGASSDRGSDTGQPLRSRIGRAMSGLSTTNANIARSPQRPRNRWP